MLKKLKELFRKKRKPTIGIVGPIVSSRIVEPVELKARSTYDASYVSFYSMESYIKCELFEKIKPFIYVEKDELREEIAAKIMILPYNENGEIV